MLPFPTFKRIFSTSSSVGPRAALDPSPDGLAWVALHLLRAYKILISPLFAGSCRFQPSCADYMSDAVRLHGTHRGILMGLRRLGRCHPFGGAGYDPVVPPQSSVRN